MHVTDDEVAALLVLLKTSAEVRSGWREGVSFHVPFLPGRASMRQPYPWTEPSSLRSPKRGCGWTGVAECIVMDHPHLLPKPVTVDPWPSWAPSKVRRFREDGSLEINLPEGTWRDHRTGEGGGIFSLLAQLLGSREAARWWLRAHGYSDPLRLDPIPPQTEEERQFAEWYRSLPSKSKPLW